MRTEKQIANDLTAIAVEQIKHPTETMFWSVAKRKALADMGCDSLPAEMVTAIHNAMLKAIGGTPSQLLTLFESAFFTSDEIKSIGK